MKLCATCRYGSEYEYFKPCIVYRDDCGLYKGEEQRMSDLIERQAIIDAMYALCGTGETLKDNPWRDNPHIDVIIGIINDLPSAEKTGHWIEKYHEVFKYYCDKCGTGSDLRTDYCPNCGADMRGEENE